MKLRASPALVSLVFVAACASGGSSATSADGQNSDRTTLSTSATTTPLITTSTIAAEPEKCWGAETSLVPDLVPLPIEIIDWDEQARRVQLRIKAGSFGAFIDPRSAIECQLDGQWLAAYRSPIVDEPLDIAPTKVDGGIEDFSGLQLMAPIEVYTVIPKLDPGLSYRLVFRGTIGERGAGVYVNLPLELSD